MVPWEPARKAAMSLDDWKKSMGAGPGAPITFGKCHCSHPTRAHGACAGGCPPDCLGDFTEPARIAAPSMRLDRPYVEHIPRRRPRQTLLSWVAGREWTLMNWLGRRALLGRCEVHGDVNLVGLFDGRLYIEQVVSWPPSTWGP